MDGIQVRQGMPQGGFQGRPPGGFPGGPGARGDLLFAGAVGIALLVLAYAVMAIAFWQFLKKAGLTPALALLMLVPAVNLGVALWAAFTEWPALREVARLKGLVASYEMRASIAPAPAGGQAPPQVPGHAS